MRELVIDVISNSIMGTFAAVVVILMQTVFSKKLSPKAILYLWIPVILRFLIPYIPESKTSIYNYIPGTDNIYIPVIPQITGNDTTEFILQIHILPAIWICGAAIIFFIYLTAYYKFIKSIRTVSYTSADFRDCIEQACKKCGIKNKVSISVFQNDMSPMIIGFVKPRILIPEKILKDFSKQQIIIVLVHELTHYKRKDRLWNALTTLINIVHWFNPLIRIITGMIQRDIENACDEKAIAIIGNDEKYTYGKTLIDLAECFPGGMFMPTVSPMASKSNSLKTRIKKIYDSGRKKLNAIALPLCIVISVTMLTGAVDTDATDKIESVVKKIEPVIAVHGTQTLKSDLQKEQPINTQSDAIADAPARSFESAGANGSSENFEVTGNTYYQSEQITEDDAFMPNPDSVDKGNKINNSSQAPSMPSESPGSSTAENPVQTDSIDTTVDYNTDTATYTYSGKNTTLILSNNPSKTGFVYESEDLKIETVGITSSSDEKINGNFNIYRNGELVQSNVRATVSASPSSISFNDEQSSDYDFSFAVQTKNVN